MSRRDPRHSEQWAVAALRRSWMIGVVAAGGLLLVAPGALGAEVRLMLEGEEDTFSEIWLDIPDGTLDVGSPVDGHGVVEPFDGPLADCGLFEFQFDGTVESSSPEGGAEIRGVVDRASYCGDAQPRHDTGEFEVTIGEDGSVVGILSFPDEAQPQRITEYVAAPNPESSSTGISVLFALLAGVTFVDVVATVICLLKGRRRWFVFGVAVSALMVLFTRDAADLGPDDGLIALAFIYGFGLIGAPLSGLLLMGASRSGKPTSWWVRRGPTSRYKSAPPPVVSPSDLGPHET